jgi:hypothetical protein
MNPSISAGWRDDQAERAQMGQSRQRIGYDLAIIHGNHRI